MQCTTTTRPTFLSTMTISSLTSRTRIINLVRCLSSIVLPENVKIFHLLNALSLPLITDLNVWKSFSEDIEQIYDDPEFQLQQVSAPTGSSYGLPGTKLTPGDRFDQLTKIRISQFIFKDKLIIILTRSSFFFGSMWRWNIIYKFRYIPKHFYSLTN